MIRVFGHYVSRLPIGMAALEGSLFFVAIAAAETSASYLSLNQYVRDPSAGSDAAAIASGALIVMISLGMYARDVLYRLSAMRARICIFFPLAFVTAYFLMHSPAVVADGGGASSTDVAIAVLLCGLIAVVVRSVFVAFIKTGQAIRLLVIGTAGTATKVSEIIRSECGRFEIVGFIDTGNNDQASSLAPIFPIKTLATPEAALRFVRYKRIDHIVVATRERRGLPIHALMECRLRGVPVSDYSIFCEMERGFLDADEIQASSLIFTDGFSVSRGRALLKALLDYFLAVAALVVTFPITIVVAVAIKASSPGPIFFFQERVGCDGKNFRVIKFRSMRIDAEKDGPRWASVADDRVTLVGRLIRKTRIDEIPQAINVLRGEMSFVGPRPERPCFVDMLRKSIPYFDIRHRVKPGITGWAQVNYPYGASEEDAHNKHGYDLYYVKNGSLFLDLLICLKTIRVILCGSGAR